MIQEAPLKSLTPLPVKKVQPLVGPTQKQGQEQEQPKTGDSKVLWISVGIIIGAVLTLISVIFVNQFVFKNEKPQVVTVTPTPVFIPTPLPSTTEIVTTPQAEDESNNAISLYGDFCNGYTVQQANCQTETQSVEFDCQNILKADKPYCNVITLDNNSEIKILSELKINTTGNTEKYSFSLGKQNGTKINVIEEIESVDGKSKVFKVNELDINTSTLTSDIYTFELIDSCLSIEYDSKGTPIKIGLNTSAEYQAVCPATKLTPEVKGQFAQLLTYY